MTRPCSQCADRPAHRDGLCPRCRIYRLGLARRRYNWSPDLIDQVRLIYSSRRKPDITRGLTALARRTGWPRWQFRILAATRGWQRINRRPWTGPDLDYLREHLGSRSAPSIARSLNRPLSSVIKRAQSLRLSTRLTDGYTLADLSAVLGVDHRRAASWVGRGLFGRPDRSGTGIRVTDRQVSIFLRRYPGLYDLARVDQEWFKSMIFGSLSGG